MIYNFSAGPATLPKTVLKQVQSELMDWQGMGISVMEISHREPVYVRLTEEIEQNLRDLMAIPNDYEVLFMQGGGRGQFSALAQNLAAPDAQVDYLNTGIWSEYAFKEAKKYIQNVHVIDAVEKTEASIQVIEQDAWTLSPKASYFHYCPNETVDGIAIHDIPTVHAPIVADMSSSILSEPLDVSKFGLIYAGAQKNIGPSGFAVVIIRKDLLHTQQSTVCSTMNYQLQAQERSMYNTPNTFAWYFAGEVFKWIQAEGGLAAMAELNDKKSRLLYECIDNSNFYENKIVSKNRSKMNIPFQLKNPELDTLFLKEAEQAGLLMLKGHRFVGGMRASLYNAMPYEGAVKLVDFMTRFQNKWGA